MSVDTQEKILSFLEKNQIVLNRVEELISKCVAKFGTSSDVLIDIKKASEITGYEPTYLYKLSSIGALKTEKRGGKLLFDRSHLEVWFLTKQKKGGLK